MATEVEVEVEIVKPHTDKREYRRIVLKNSLEVLLISDPDTDKANSSSASHIRINCFLLSFIFGSSIDDNTSLSLSLSLVQSAASMNVGVGYSSDPVGLEGLAHFLEHMLFYASEKYPMEGSYSKYILENGGQYNACTSYEHTNYHFEVNSDCFEEALDRFAQFFLGPLLSADATMREIKAVDSGASKARAAEVKMASPKGGKGGLSHLGTAKHNEVRQGTRTHEDVVALLFKYIHLLQESGVRKWIFDEDNQMCHEQAVYYLSRNLTYIEISVYAVSQTDLMKYMLFKPLITSWIEKWLLALSEFTLVYFPQKAMKRQVLADFLANHSCLEVVEPVGQDLNIFSAEKEP
ncbi:hypothetical protein GH714_033693 [Hevea brasiliensis]|uniref:Peptidase M16 N-terminal domain-containing protein n=1 Tax=Hevea brasiliensis TaxID=3981 RepID=A0A6A6M2M9_HEVBR|nr:hypothetical protein GH714_033693 [Hevea brasiliensis]